MFGKCDVSGFLEDTLSIARETKPAGFFRYFMEHGCEIVELGGGGYYRILIIEFVFLEAWEKLWKKVKQS